MVFLQKCMEHFIYTKLLYQMTLHKELKTLLKRIQIIDTTVFTFPPHFKSMLPGIYRADLNVR